MATSIWKFSLRDAFHGCKVEMPRGAQVLRVALQHGEPTMWCRVDEEAPPVVRHFSIYGTGAPLPEGARYLASIDSPPFVWHVFEVSTPIPEQVRALPLAAQNAYRLLIADGFTQRWDNGTHAWVEKSQEPLTTEQMKAVAELQEHGFGAVVCA